jgi:hypothetical protein
MKTTGWAVIAATTAIVGLFAVADATAQYGGGMTGGGRRANHLGTGVAPGTSRPATQENVTDLVEFRLALLQEDLKLTREQERAWIAYEERTRALAADISRERSRSQNALSMNAMQQVNHAVDHARDQLAAWEEIAPAAKALYDSLTPEQKALADARMPSIVAALTVGSPAGFFARSERPGNRAVPSRSPGTETKLTP